MRFFRIRPALRALLPFLLLASGCLGRTDQEVIVYAALDQEFSEPILRTFSQEQELSVRSVFDVEAAKTVGLTNRLLEERRRPRCDVFWNNEILHTLRLARAGLLEPYHSPAAENFPANYRAGDGTWTGLAARARVLLVNTQLIEGEQSPDSVLDLVDARWKGRCGIARPLFGTTATHAAVLFSRWGDEQAENFFRQVKDNAVVLPGNKQVAQAVADGQLVFGLTDTDDAIIELRRGRPVRIVFPDQAADRMGTLFIPNTIAIIKGGPHPQAARRLVDYVLSAEVEKRLAAGPSAQFPVRTDVAQRPDIPGASDARWMDVDFPAAADHWETSSRFLYDLFSTSDPADN